MGCDDSAWIAPIQERSQSESSLRNKEQSHVKKKEEELTDTVIRRLFLSLSSYPLRKSAWWIVQKQLSRRIKPQLTTSSIRNMSLF